MKIEEEIQSSFKDEYHKLVVNLHLTFSRITENFQDVLKEYNLTATQYNVLRILRGQKGSPASIGLIKERMIERNSDVSRVIERLLKKELIERKQNSIDKRQRDIFINDNGLTLLNLLNNNQKDFSDMLSHVSPNEVKEMNNLLDKLRSEL